MPESIGVSMKVNWISIFIEVKEVGDALVQEERLKPGVRHELY
jgi:hypothetical protein